MNRGAFLMRGLDKVRAEFSLTALVYNLRRALNILGVARLMAGRGRMKDAHHCTKSVGKSRSGSSRRRQGRDSRSRQQKSIKARETHIVNGLTPDFSHGLLNFRNTAVASKMATL